MNNIDGLELPDNTPVGMTRVKPLIQEDEGQKEGFVDTVSNIFKRTNYIYTGYNYLNDHNFAAGPALDDSVPEGWKPLTLESTEGVPEPYWQELAKAETPKQLEVIRSRIFDQLDLDERIGRGGIIGRLSGSFISGALDPLNLIPVYGQLRYAKLGAGFVKNMIKAAPSVALTVGLSEAALNATQETDTLKDWTWNTLTGTIVGSAFASGIKTSIDAYKIKKHTAILNAIDKDIDIKADINPDGTFNKYVAEAGEGKSVGAAEVKDIEDIVNGGIDLYGENEFFKLVTKFSPNVRGLTNYSKATAQFTELLFDNSWVTNTIKKGLVPDISGERKFITWMALKDNILSETKRLWVDSLEFKGPLKETRAQLQEGQAWTDISKQVAIALRNNEKSDNPIVAKIASTVRTELMDKVHQQFVDKKILQAGLKPKTAESYLTKIWDRDALSVNENEFTNTMYRFLEERNQVIDELTAPLKFKEAEIKALKEDLRSLKKNKANAETIKSVQERLKGVKTSEEQIRKDIQSKIDSGEIEPIYTEGAPSLSPIRQMELDELTKGLREATDALKNAKTDIEKKAAKQEIKKQKLSIEEKINDGKVDESLFWIDGKGRPHLFEFDKKPWLLPNIPKEKWKEVAQSYHTSLMQMEDEELMAMAFSGLSQGGTNPLKQRTVMLPDNVFQEFLVNDFEKVLSVYTGFSSRYMALHDVYTKFGSDIKSGQKDLIQRISGEYRKNRQSLLVKSEKISPDERKKIIDENLKKGLTLEQASSEQFAPSERAVETERSPARDKAIRKLDEKLKEELQFIENATKVFMGNYGDRNSVVSRMLKSQRDLAASTMRGAVLLTQIAELFAPIIQEGPIQYIQQGLIPTLKFLIKNKSLRREDFADARIAVEIAHGYYMDRVWGDGVHYSPKTTPEKVLSNLAKASGNIFLTNQMTDFNKFVTASISQAKIIRLMEKHLKGENFTKKEREYLGLIRLDPDKWASRIMTQFNTPGIGERVDGSFIANFRKWKDFEAAQAFRSAMSKEVDMIISKPNMLDVPFALRNPFLASMTQFMSWSFGSTANYVLPLLQRPDAERLTGMLMMMAAASLVGPLRKLSAGEEVNLDPQYLATEAFFNSGVLGIYGDVFARVNASFNIGRTTSRYQGKNFSEMLLGPLGGMGQLGFDLVNASINGQMSKTDVKKLIKIMPFLNAFYLRRLTNDWVDGLSLPNRRSTITE